MKGTRAHFFDYWAPQKKKKVLESSERQRGALFPGVTACQASKWQVKRREMMMMRMMRMTMMQRGTFLWQQKQRVRVWKWSSDSVWSPTAAQRRASTALVITQRSEWNTLLLMGNTIESNEVTKNSLSNKKITESSPGYNGSIALLFLFFLSIYIHYKGRRHFHVIILSN